jgi:uncharacterized protein (UPF0179 family)
MSINEIKRIERKLTIVVEILEALYGRNITTNSSKATQIESDMKNLKVGQESLKKDLQELKEGLQELKEGQSRISAVIYKRIKMK